MDREVVHDQELWVEHGEERMGPFRPAGGPIPLHRYRKHRKSRQEVRADRVADLAGKLALPRAAVSGEDGVVVIGLHGQAAAAALPQKAAAIADAPNQNAVTHQPPFRDPLGAGSARSARESREVLTGTPPSAPI